MPQRRLHPASLSDVTEPRVSRILTATERLSQVSRARIELSAKSFILRGVEDVSPPGAYIEEWLGIAKDRFLCAVKGRCD